jgi:ATP-dependent Clp protease ATP-binding subunit ClpA
MGNERQSIFSKYTRNIDSIRSPLHNRPEISHLMDILGRQQNNHAIIFSPPSIKIRQCIQETLAYCFTCEEKPKIAENAKIVFFDVAEFALQNDGPLSIENNFLEFCKEWQNQNIIFIMNQITPFLATDTKSPLGCLGKCLKSILSAKNWRLIFLADDIPDEQQGLLRNYFSFIYFSEFSIEELKNILLIYKEEISQFHNVEIPEETSSSALMLAHYYLSAQNSLDKAYELLDSASSRIANKEIVLITSMLTEVISTWTQIPLPHLQNNKFESNKFLETVQRSVLGQQGALTMIASALQQACVQLQEKSAPFCSFIFAGPTDTGKTKTAYAIAEHLFGHKHVLLEITNNLNVKMHGDFINLIEAIKQMPYAVLLFENINQNLQLVAELFNLIRQREELFSHSIVILTTSTGSENILNLFQHKPEETPQTLDLLDLVLNEKTQDIPLPPAARTTNEINEEVMPQLESMLTKEILDKTYVIPFLPLDYTAVEKLVRLKIKDLSKHLEEKYEIELLTAPEVIKFLAHEIFWRNPQRKQLDKLLEQNLYSCIAHEILTRSEDKNRTPRLSLKLHDNGHMLKCDFISNVQKSNLAAEF